MDCPCASGSNSCLFGRCLCDCTQLLEEQVAEYAVKLLLTGEVPTSLMSVVLEVADGLWRGPHLLNVYCSGGG